MVEEDDFAYLTFGGIFISIFALSLLLSIIFCRYAIEYIFFFLFMIFICLRKKKEEKYDITVIHEVQEDLTIRWDSSVKTFHRH